MGNKILEKLCETGQVSMMNDIFPMVLDEFGHDLSDVNMVQDYITQLLCACITAGVEMVCVPVFSDDAMPGELSVVDMIYRKI